MRTCLWSRAVLAAIAVGLAALLFAGLALAVRPVSRAHYFGFPSGASVEAGFVDVTGELRVPQSGGHVAPAKLAFSCRNGRDVRVRLSGSAGRRSPVRVGRDGRFVAVGSGGETLGLVRPRSVARYRLQGRFLTRESARIIYTERRVRSHRLVCRSSMTLYREGVPPFSGCGSQRAVTVLRGDTGRVFLQYAAQLPGSGGEFGLGSFIPHAYACLFDSPSKRIDLGENYAPDDERLNFRLAGPFLAFFHGGCAMCIFEQFFIEVRDLRNGTIVRRIGYPESYPDLMPWGSRPAALALKANGSLAWTLDRIAMDSHGFPVGYGDNEPPVVVAWEVWALDTSGPRLLDSGPKLVLDSLELHDSSLTWIDDGVTRTATLD
jgi:hypothetical protein